MPPENSNNMDIAHVLFAVCTWAKRDKMQHRCDDVVLRIRRKEYYDEQRNMQRKVQRCIVIFETVEITAGIEKGIRTRGGRIESLPRS
jgi:hypothetical protein